MKDCVCERTRGEIILGDALETFQSTFRLNTYRTRQTCWSARPLPVESRPLLEQ